MKLEIELLDDIHINDKIYVVLDYDPKNPVIEEYYVDGVFYDGKKWWLVDRYTNSTITFIGIDENIFKNIESAESFIKIYTCVEVENASADKE